VARRPRRRAWGGSGARPGGGGSGARPGGGGSGARPGAGSGARLGAGPAHCLGSLPAWVPAARSCGCGRVRLGSLTPCRLPSAGRLSCTISPSRLTSLSRRPALHDQDRFTPSRWGESVTIMSWPVPARPDSGLGRTGIRRPMITEPCRRYSLTAFRPDVMPRGGPDWPSQFAWWRLRRVASIAGRGTTTGGRLGAGTRTLEPGPAPSDRVIPTRQPPDCPSPGHAPPRHFPPGRTPPRRRLAGGIPSRRPPPAAIPPRCLPPGGIPARPVPPASVSPGSNPSGSNPSGGVPADGVPADGVPAGGVSAGLVPSRTVQPGRVPSGAI
jgi:hypothetical protein